MAYELKLHDNMPLKIKLRGRKMTNTPTPLIAGNWKMNGLAADSLSTIGELIDKAAKAGSMRCDILICPPAVLLRDMASAANSSAVNIGGQDCHMNEKGAHTGDISAEMIADSGATYCIVGHSERRTDHGETDAVVQQKASAVHRAGLIAIICVGEILEERESGTTLGVISKQLSGSIPSGCNSENTVIAYEPVWAIGTGKTSTADDVRQVHAHIRQEISGKIDGSDATRLLYGGSVKGSNADELMAVANVDGALVGGASLKSEDFWPIVNSCI